MQYLVYRQEGNLGPFSLAELQHKVAAGTVKPEDLAWHEGMTTWAPVTEMLSSAATITTATGSVVPSAVATGAPAESIRLANLPREQNVRSIGTYFYFNAGLQIVLGVFFLLCGVISYFAGKGQPLSALIAVAVYAIILLGISALCIWAGHGLRQLDRRGKVPALIVLVIGLLGFPVGTVTSGIFLYLLMSAKGQYLLTEEYRGIVAATPQIQWKTAWWVWLLIGLFLLAFVSVLVISVLLMLGQTVKGIQPAQH